MENGHFTSIYQVYTDLINVVSEDLKILSKFLGALDLSNQEVIRRSGSFFGLLPMSKKEEMGLPGTTSHLQTYCQEEGV